MKKKHITLVKGGISSEREVSLSSAKSIAIALKNLGYEVTEFDPKIDGLEKLFSLKTDVIFNALHGTYGEDGCIEGIFECTGIPYTHSGVKASSVGFDKIFSKILFEKENLSTPTWQAIDFENLDNINLNFPFVVKPACEGSSVNVFIIKNEEDFANLKLQHQLKKYNKLLVEEYIPGKEISAAVLKGKALGIIELNPLAGFYDYNNKYTNNKTEHIYPANIPSDIYQKVMNMAEKAHDIIGCSTLSRSDFRYNPETKEVYILEINTHPGMTSLSLFPEIASYNQINFDELINIIVNDAKLKV